MVLAPHVTAARRDGVAFDGLLFECRAGRSPVLKRSGFEIEVEGTAVFAGGEDAVDRGGAEERGGGDHNGEDETSNNQHRTSNFEPRTLNLEFIREFRELARITNR